MFDFEEGNEDGDASEYRLPWERIEGKSCGRQHGLCLGKPVVKNSVEQRDSIWSRVRS
jgi:hypothetical protein